MCKGEMVESGAVDEVLSHPRHDYTRRLVDAVPEIMGHSGVLRGSTTFEGQGEQA